MIGPGLCLFRSKPVRFGTGPLFKFHKHIGVQGERSLYRKQNTLSRLVTLLVNFWQAGKGKWPGFAARANFNPFGNFVKVYRIRKNQPDIFCVFGMYIAFPDPVVPFPQFPVQHGKPLGFKTERAFPLQTFSAQRFNPVRDRYRITPLGHTFAVRFKGKEL